jgi:hypothetical protein
MIVSSFIIQANVITIVNYDRKTFIVQATDLRRNRRSGSEDFLSKISQQKFTNPCDMTVLMKLLSV